MKIFMTWQEGYDDEAPWMVSAYDEITAEANGGVPEFHAAAIERVNRPGLRMRDVVVNVPDSAILGLFDPGLSCPRSLSSCSPG